jgi:phosphate:Na+ symporter
MKNGFSPLKDMPEFTAWFSRFSPDSHWGVIKCVLVGTIVTGVIQSSSATVGITMGLAFNGIIDYPTAAALVLGQNIGTTVTALLASIGTSVNARRAALAHTIFNVLGVVLVIPIFFPYIKFVQAFIHWHSGLSAADCLIVDGKATYPHMMEAIALTHTIFNIANTLIFLPLTTQLAKLLVHIIPERAVPEKPKLTSLDVRLFNAPAIGIEQSQNEIVRIGSVVV